VAFRLELVTVPVAEVDRAKAFSVDQVGFSRSTSRTSSRRAALRAGGVPATDVQDFPWGRFCFFTDPDGNGWSVHEPPAD
jgi:uncharacterized glyoxalase superfamily protein PhnB